MQGTEGKDDHEKEEVGVLGFLGHLLGAQMFQKFLFWHLLLLRALQFQL
jgi:hypothetical protein